VSMRSPRKSSASEGSAPAPASPTWRGKCHEPRWR
jgi:hypothetical protein